MVYPASGSETEERHVPSEDAPEGRFVSEFRDDAKQTDVGSEKDYDPGLSSDQDEDANARSEDTDDAEELKLRDLELDLDPGDEQAEAKAPAEEDLEFDLDLDLDQDEEQPVLAKAADDTEELKLPDLELDLDLGDEQAEAKAPEGEEPELELDFDQDEPEKVQTPIGEEELEFETDSESEGTRPASTEPDELELDLDFGAQSKRQGDELHGESVTSEIGITDETGSDKMEMASEMDSHEEFDIGDIKTDEENPAELEADETRFSDEALIKDYPESEADEISETGESRSAPRKRISTPLLVLLIIIILGAGGYGAFTVLDRMGIQIPVISDFFRPPAPDAGNLKINTLDITSKFLDNSKIGRIFVISGNAKNEYSDPRGLIKITGKLYTQGKVMAKSRTVYCGNLLSDLELSDLEADAINKRLLNRSGSNRSNLKVEPGKLIPFMLVFTDLPENLEEFSIEAQGSMPFSEGN